MRLRAYDVVAVDAVTVETKPSAGLPVPRSTKVSWDVTFTAYATGAVDGVTVTVSVAVVGPNGTGDNTTTAVIRAGRDNAVNVTLHLDEVDAWWPVGLGAPSLYNATVTVCAVDPSDECSNISFPMGFRTVSLQRPPAPDGVGRLYYFEVNGAPLYVKGANWVPPDAFPTRGDTAAHFLPKLDSFVAAGFNTLRVWGGGYPPADAFYIGASERGLLLWQVRVRRL